MKKILINAISWLFLRLPMLLILGITMVILSPFLLVVYVLNIFKPSSSSQDEKASFPAWFQESKQLG